jgi:hypothetical protein
MSTQIIKLTIIYQSGDQPPTTLNLPLILYFDYVIELGQITIKNWYVLTNNYKLNINCLCTSGLGTYINEDYVTVSFNKEPFPDLFIGVFGDISNITDVNLKLVDKVKTYEYIINNVYSAFEITETFETPKSTGSKYMSFTLHDENSAALEIFPSTIFLSFEYFDFSIINWYNVNEDLTIGDEIIFDNFYLLNKGSFDDVLNIFTVDPNLTEGIKTYPYNDDACVIDERFYSIKFGKTDKTSIITIGGYGEFEGVYTFTDQLESLYKVVVYTFINTPPGFPQPLKLGFKYEINSGAILNWYNMDNTCINSASEINYYCPAVGTYNASTEAFFNFAVISDITDIKGDYLYIKLYANTETPEDNIITGIDVDDGTSYNTYECKVDFIGDCCFSEGTKILSLTNFKNGIYEEDIEKSLEKSLEVSLTSQIKEEYILVQDLKIGDLVKTYLHGYRRISRVLKGNFKNNPKEKGVANCMYRMLKTKDNGLIDDLTLTRNHGVLVEKLSENEEKNVYKKNLEVVDGLLSIITADSDKFEKVEDTNVYNYYHFSLDGDGDNDRRFGIYANGLLVETPSNNMMDKALHIKPLDF